MTELLSSFFRALLDGWWMSADVWRSAKDSIEMLSPVGNAALHLIAGGLIFISFGMTAQSQRRWKIGWVAALILALWNELVDISTERWPSIVEQIAEGATDIAVTMAIPTLSAVVVCALIPQKGLHRMPEAEAG